MLVFSGMHPIQHALHFSTGHRKFLPLDGLSALSLCKPPAHPLQAMHSCLALKWCHASKPPRLHSLCSHVCSRSLDHQTPELHPTAQSPQHPRPAGGGFTAGCTAGGDGAVHTTPVATLPTTPKTCHITSQHPVLDAGSGGGQCHPTLTHLCLLGLGKGAWHTQLPSSFALATGSDPANLSPHSDPCHHAYLAPTPHRNSCVPQQALTLTPPPLLLLQLKVPRCVQLPATAACCSSCSVLPKPTPSLQSPSCSQPQAIDRALKAP